MTLIAALYTDDGPLIIGDLMASGPASNSPSSHTHMVLPAGYVPIAANQGDVPVAAVQKVVVINDECVLCWSGDMRYVPRIISEIRRECVFNGTSMATINGWHQRQDLNLINHQALIVVWREGGNQFYFWANPRAENLSAQQKLGQLFAAGSGTKHLLDVLNRTKTWKELKGIPRGSKSIAAGLILVTELFNMEAFHRVAHAERYGLGYEICTWRGNKFEKLDDFVLAHTLINIDKNYADLLAPLSVVKIEYDGGTTRLTAIPRKPNGSHDLLQMVARAPDQLQYPQPNPPSEVMLNANHYGISVNALVGDKVILEHLKHVQLQADDDDRPIHFTVADDLKGVSIGYSQDFGDKAFDWAKRAPRRYVKSMRINLESQPATG